MNNYDYTKKKLMSNGMLADDKSVFMDYAITGVVGLCILVFFCYNASYSAYIRKLDRLADTVVASPKQYIVGDVVETSEGLVAPIHIDGFNGKIIEHPYNRMVEIYGSWMGKPVVEVSQDINKSKIIGKWAGAKSKEFMAGFKEAYKNSEFMKLENK